MGDNHSFFEQLKRFLQGKDWGFSEPAAQAVVDLLKSNQCLGVQALKRVVEDGKASFKTDYQSTTGVFYALEAYVKDQDETKEQGSRNRKRKVTASSNGLDRLRKGLSRITPSSFSKVDSDKSYTVLLKRNTSKTRDFPIYPGRNDPSRMHIEYLFPIFYEFSKRCQSADLDLDGLEPKRRISKHAVLELCEVQEAIFSSEGDREQKGLEWLNKHIFGPIQLGAHKMEVNKCTTDGMVVSHKNDLEKTLCMIEFKLEIGEQGDAFIQGLTYYAQQIATHDDLSCRPCFIIEFVGPNLRIGGALVACDGSVCGNKLVQMFSLAKPGEKELVSLVNVLNSFCIALDQLEESYLEFGLARQEISHVLPAFVLQALSEVLPDFELQDTKIEKEGRIFVLSGIQSSKTASYVIKLSETYCEDLHRILAEKGFAPKLYFHGSPPSPWDDSFYKLSIMEFIQTANVVTLNPSEKASVLKDLCEIKRLMQTLGYVHGDLRNPNILCNSDGEVKLVDFDWSGKQGSTVYPANINLELRWPIKDPAGALIEYEHDHYYIDNFIRTYKLSSLVMDHIEVESTNFRP